MLALTCVAESLAQRVALAVEPSSLDWRPDARSAAVPGDFGNSPC